MIFAAVSVLAALIGSELFVRWRGPELLGISQDDVQNLRTFLREGHQIITPFPYAGFVAKSFDPDAPVLQFTAGGVGRVDPTRPVDWSFEFEREPGVLRIACLGGSTTWGGYPLLLKQILEERTGRQVQVMNWGVPAWTSMETMVNYFVVVQDYEPDIVILMHAINDVTARLSRDYRADYSHWRIVWNEPRRSALHDAFLLRSDLYAAFVIRAGDRAFHLREYVSKQPRGSFKTLDDLPEGSADTFERNVRTIARDVTAKGGALVLVTQPTFVRASRGEEPTLGTLGAGQHNAILRTIAQENGFCLVDLESEFAALDEKTRELLFTDVVHLIPKGQQREAERIADRLQRAGLVGARDE